MSATLAIEDLSFAHGARRVLGHASFTAHGRDFIAVLGVNGAGKSTLLDILAGLREADAGTVTVEGRVRQRWTMRELAQRVSHLPQAVSADLPFTAGELVAMGRYPHTDRWFESEADHAAIRRAMERALCWEYRDRVFGSLSGGERQRVLLAACLAQDASTLLLDEPSTYLDVEQQLHCFALLREEADAGKLCIAVTHDLNIALTHCTRLMVLAQGRIAWDVSAAEAREDAAWLREFSPRLQMGATPAGTPWVWYR